VLLGSGAEASIRVEEHFFALFLEGVYGLGDVGDDTGAGVDGSVEVEDERGVGGDDFLH